MPHPRSDVPVTSVSQPLGSSFTLMPCISDEDARPFLAAGVRDDYGSTDGAIESATAVVGGVSSSRLLPLHAADASVPVNDSSAARGNDCQLTSLVMEPSTAATDVARADLRRATVSPFEPVRSVSAGDHNVLRANRRNGTNGSKPVPHRRRNSLSSRRFSTKRYYFGLPKPGPSPDSTPGLFQPPKESRLYRHHHAPVVRSVTHDHADVWDRPRHDPYQQYHQFHHPPMHHHYQYRQYSAPYGYHAYASSYPGYYHAGVSRSCDRDATVRQPWKPVPDPVVSPTSRDLCREFTQEAMPPPDRSKGHFPYYSMPSHRYGHCVVSPVTTEQQHRQTHDRAPDSERLVDLPETIFIANGYTSVPVTEDISDDEDEDYDDGDYDEDEEDAF